VADYFEIMGVIPHAIWHNEPGDSDWDSVDDILTAPILGSFPVLTLQCRRREAVPDYFESGSKPIVSAKFRNLAERFSVAAEFLPVNLLDYQGNPARGGPYWFMHMLEEIDCIDLEQSEYETLSDRPDSLLRRVRKLSFRPEMIGDRAMFRPHRYLQMFVTGGVREEIVRERLKLSLTPLSEVRLGC
jgi:hypothetical protein